MRLHEYSVSARFRYNDLKVGISSGNLALKRCAFVGINPTGELITSGLPVIRAQSRKAPLISCEGGYFYGWPAIRQSGFGPSRRSPRIFMMRIYGARF